MNEVPTIESPVLPQGQMGENSPEMLLPKEPFNGERGTVATTEGGDTKVDISGKEDENSGPEVTIVPQSFLGYPVSADVLPASIVNDKANDRPLPVAA